MLELHGKKNTNENYIEICVSPILLTNPKSLTCLNNLEEKSTTDMSADCVTPREETLGPGTKGAGVSTPALTNTAPGPITQAQPHSGELICMVVWWKTTQPYKRNEATLYVLTWKDLQTIF